MEYTSGGPRHSQYPQQALHQEFSNLSLNRVPLQQSSISMNSEGNVSAPQNVTYEHRQVESALSSDGYGMYHGQVPIACQIPNASLSQQQHQITHQALINSHFDEKNTTLLTGGGVQSQRSYLHPTPPTHLTNANVLSPHITPVHSQTPSPIRSSLGGAQLASSLLPKASEGTLSGVHASTDDQSSIPSRTSVLSQLGNAQVISSATGSVQTLGQENASPLSASTTAQSRLVGAQLGSTWNASECDSLRLGQAPSINFPSQYGSGVVNGHFNEAHSQYQHQIHCNEGYSSLQQANLSYTGISQNQYFNQEQSFAFNVNYIDSTDPNTCQDYYYGSYQYDGTYSGSFDSIDPNYLGTPVGRAPTPYGDETVEDLGPEMVRWFYKVEADKKWTPFIGYDSLRIEWKYRDLLQDASPCETQTETFSNAGSEHSSPKEPEKSEVGERIVVRGGLYEVDVKHRKCESIYWQGEVFMISRGTWFYEGAWGPVEETIADRIEYEHLLNFRGHLLSSQRLDDATKEVVHSLCISEGQVDWFSASEVYLSSDGTPSRLMRSVGKKLGFQKTGYKLHRGYSIDATASDKPPDINHIVFVIHGIGQKMERGRIIKNCTALRENINFIKQKYFLTIAKSSQTVEFFPVEWRSSLVLDAGVIENITPHKILNIRQMLNASFMDIMYYNSPLYREEVIKGLTGEMNRLYTMFTQRNPYFEANGGKVSIIAHSLGCVITYDIVTEWNPAQQFDQQLVKSLIACIEKKDDGEGTSKLTLKRELKEVVESYESHHPQPSLDFKIENFFCMGSPLAVFLALRTKSTDGECADIIPQTLCKRLLNIYHPADPVAYRIEPLLCPQYYTIAPLIVHSYNAAEKVPYADMPLEPLIISREKEKEGGEKSRGDSEGNTPVSSVPSTPVKGGSSSWSWWGLMKGNKKSDSGTSSQDAGSALQNTVGLPDRIDFVLREGSMENSYISAVTSHTAYWTNYDVAHFILSIMYPDIQPTIGKADLLKS
ncbi:Phospholipase ddhd1 [Halocaridina rubra]|uniref:Phospholipase ddhd1 n=1 Tax=Halocaridina rubra TaxID=373956 RepID=A0AAN9AGA2_HALRR